MKEELKKFLLLAIEKAFPAFKAEEDLLEILVPADDFGDYSTNLALKMAGKVGEKPLKIAEKLKIALEKESVVGDCLEKIEVAKPGFLNFSLSTGARGKIIQTINREQENFGSATWGKGKKIHLDFVSANPTGPIHLGNGRGGPLGDTLAKVLEKVGFSVWREYYVNDFGNQIKILGHSILQDEEAQYKGEYLNELRKRNKEKEPFLAGQAGAKIILENLIQPTMEKMRIFFDQYFSESTLHKEGWVEKVFKILKEKNYLYEKDGAWWFRATNFGDEKDRVVRKRTGEITYFGGDIAYHYHKLQKRKFDLAIDIWGADHHGDVRRILSALEALDLGGKIKVILTQNLTVIKNGREFKMSKRKGQYICLEDLIEEVGVDAVRFIFLSFSADSPMVFDINLAQEKSDKNPVYYVQYASARLAGILEKTAKLEKYTEEADFNQLKKNKEKELIKHLMLFPALVTEVAASRQVHRLVHYAIRLADKFHSFYQDCRILNEEKTLAVARRELVKATRVVLQENLRLLGVTAPEKM